MKKKTLASMMLVTFLSLTPTNLLAGGVSSVTDINVSIEVLPSKELISLDMPLSQSFNIGEDEFYPDITYTNNSVFPIEIMLKEIIIKDSKTPKIVSPTKHTEHGWLALPEKDTHREIALGLHLKDNPDNVTWLSLNSSVKLMNLDRDENKTLNFTSLYGQRWKEEFLMNYEFTIVAKPKLGGY